MEEQRKSENALVPALRFKGFNDPWEQRKLGELYVERGENGREGLPILSVSIHHGVSSGQLDSSDLGKVVRRSEDKSLYKKVETGDLVLNMMRAWQGAIGAAGVSGMVSPAYIVAMPLSVFDQAFMNVLLRRKDLVRQINDLSYGVTDFRKRIYWPSLITAKTSLPSYEEQTRIGALFQKLDSLIALHQRKHDKLKTVKQSLLEKMFPKEGESVPEIRFEGFTEPWEQRKLGEFATLYKESVPTPSEGHYRLGVRSHGRGTFLEWVAPGKQIGEMVMQKVKAGNLVVNIVFAWEHAVAITSSSDEKALVSHRFPQYEFDRSVYPAFIGLLVLDESFRHHLWLSSPSGAGRNKTLRQDEMLEYEFFVPTLEEQQAVSAFFAKLDSLIALHQRELEILKNLKKAMLEKMFV